MIKAVDILECPTTRSPLKLVDSDLLKTAQGVTYQVVDGIVRFAPGSDVQGNCGDVSEWYNNFGWQQDENGVFLETKSALDMRESSIAFTRKCITRFQKYFAAGGKYLLDAGCGPIPHKELLKYGEGFDKRICLDLSFHALQIAKAQLGDRGIYLEADVTRIPIKSDTVDAITCNHVIYQVPVELQAAALNELWRVLKPGGVCVVIYWWPQPKLQWRLGNLAKLLGLRRPPEQALNTASITQPFSNAPQPRSWFEAQAWPFDFDYDIFRVVDNGFMKDITDDWRGRRFFDLLFALQVIAPRFCGKYGRMPAIIFRKS